MNVLRATAIQFGYVPSAPVLRDVSVDVEAGEVVCVLGPNGAGKSTLLKSLAGLLAPEEGAVSLDGEDLSRLDARRRAQRVAVVPQWLARVPEIRVGDFVLGGRYGHLDRWRRASAQDHASVRTSLEAAKIGDLAERSLPTLSGGQRRRAMVARALAQEARFLLVDEPTSELDPEHQLAIFGLLRELASSGHGVLVVTHDLNLASQFADRLVLLASGRVVVEGAPEAVLRDEILADVYAAPFQTGRWATRDGDPKPFAVPWLPPRSGAGTPASDRDR